MYLVIAAKRRLLQLLAAAAFLLLLVLLSRSASLPAASSSRLLPVYEVDTKEPFVAVSFDASWGAEHTEEILDVLDSYGVKTTFSWSTSGWRTIPSWRRRSRPGAMRSASIPPPTRIWRNCPKSRSTVS